MRKTSKNIQVSIWNIFFLLLGDGAGGGAPRELMNILLIHFIKKTLGFLCQFFIRKHWDFFAIFYNIFEGEL